MFSSLSPCPWDAMFQQSKDVRSSKRAGGMGSCGKLENVAGKPLSFSLHNFGQSKGAQGPAGGVPRGRPQVQATWEQGAARPELL